MITYMHASYQLNLQMDRFSDPVHTEASDSGSLLTGVEADEVFCCCNTSSARCCLLWVLKCFSAHHGWKRVPIAFLFVQAILLGWGAWNCTLQTALCENDIRLAVSEILKTSSCGTINQAKVKVSETTFPPPPILTWTLIKDLLYFLHHLAFMYVHRVGFLPHISRVSGMILNSGYSTCGLAYFCGVPSTCQK